MIRRVQDGIAAIFGGKMLFTPIRIETPVWWTIKTKLILAASFLVIFSLQFSSLFNRTALDKLYLESNLIDLAINGKDILYGYEELAEQDDHHDPARVEAALRAARHELFDRLGMEEPAGAMSGYGGDLKIAMVTPEGRISYSTDSPKIQKLELSKRRFNGLKRKWRCPDRNHDERESTHPQGLAAPRSDHLHP